MQCERARKEVDVLPLVKGRPRHLDRANDALLKVLRVLLHDNDALLQGVLLVDLLLELVRDETVRVPVDPATSASSLPIEPAGNQRTRDPPSHARP